MSTPLPLIDVAVYGAMWAVFGLAHSLLASESMKARLHGWLGAGYRLAYNGFAIVTLVAVFLGGHAFLGALPAYDLSGTQKVVLGGLEIAGWVLMFLALGGYDLGRFAGTAQVRAAKGGGAVDEDGPLRIDGLHRYVRHPLYSAVFLILWGAAWSPLGLMTAFFGSVYLVVGTWLEERRLIARYGDAYAAYRACVPAFVPWRGRAHL
tara:strand:+ start:46380 stop:47000 length:621 start_codon:yes stop_codon:yes gene_type:complete